MFDKKKLNFWRLAFIFTAFIVIVLMLLWSMPNTEAAKMMNTNMGNMMKSMHLSNITIYDLFTNEGYQSQISQMQNHHQNQASIIYNLSFLSTATIFFLIPLIIGGTIILGIVWIR